jgi:ankyrin repeat protein
MTELLNNFDCNNNNNNNKEISLTSTYNNEQILYRSCLIGDLERVQYLLQSNSSSSIDLNRQNSDGLTLLHFACTNNFYGLVQLLLQYHANNHIRDHLGRTCLHYASIKGYRAIINLLIQSIEHSSDQHDFIYSNDNQKKNSLDYACENDHIDLVEIFLQYTDMDHIDLTSPLYYSSIEGHFDVCHLLISKQRERKDLFHLQPSLIQNICHRGHIEILRLLIEYCSISSQQRDCGNSILFYCITTFDIDLVRNLLERQARLTEKDIHDLISFCPLNDQNHFYIDHYFDCLELLIRYRLNFDDQKICKYFIRELCEKCTTIIIGKKLKYLFALAIYTGSIQLYRRSTIKWCGEINILTKRYVNLIDVIKQATKNWSLKHLLRLKIKRSMKIFNTEQIKKLPGLKEHHINFLSFEYL